MITDIHAHILPFLDDGSKDLESSINMIKDEIGQGVERIILTPHHIYRRYNKSVDEIKESLNLLSKEVEKQNLNIKLYLGQEIYFTEREDIISMLINNELLTLNNTKYVLLEMSFTDRPEDLEDVFYRFSIHGFKVIFAHVERYEWINYYDISLLKAQGVKIQINAGSLLGDNGFKKKLFVKKLLKNNLVDYIASDVHYFRKSEIKKVMKKVNNPSLFEGKNLFE